MTLAVADLERALAFYRDGLGLASSGVIAAELHDEVSGLLARAQAAGARVTGGPRERPWGIYSGYFEDLDGHLWEIIWQPETPGGVTT